MAVDITTLTGEVFKEGMQTGYLFQNTYYPLTGPVPKAMDRKYAVMTYKGPKAVVKGEYVIKNEQGVVIDVVSEEVFNQFYKQK